MKIGLSTTGLEPCHNKGLVDGIGVYTSHLREGLGKSGHRVVSYSFPPKSSGQHLLFSTPFPARFWVLSGLGIFSSGLIRQNLAVDLLHVTDYRVVPARCPVVVTLHDAIPFKFPEMCNPHFRRLKNFVTRATARFADHIIVPSTSSIPEIVEYYGLPEEAISVVPCGVESSWLAEVPGDGVTKVLDKYGLKRGYFLFVGTIQPRKNLDLIADVYTRLPESVKKDRKFVCVGRPGWRCEQTVAKLTEMVAGGDAIWLNHVTDQEELRCLYAGAGMLVFPSLYEGFGIPVLEAFACGVPVITSNVSSLPEVSCGIGIEIDPTSFDQLYGAMEWLATDEAECRRRAVAGKERAREMTWEATVKKTLDVYAKIVGGYGNKR